MDSWFISILSILVLLLGRQDASPALILTSYIVNNQTELARNLSHVDPSLFLNVTSHSGFLNVDSQKDSNLFFWYFPVVNKPLNSTPWILWLQGGPGATSLFGLFDEIGPFQYVNNTLKLRDTSWGEDYSLLFVDNPVGAGFSFTTTESGFVRSVDQSSEQLYDGLQQFLAMFPELRTAPLFVAGESYAGHFVPALAEQVLHPPQKFTKLNTGDTKINLKGVMLGNPIIDRADVADLTAVYEAWGLLDTQTAIAARPLQQKYKDAILKGKDEEAFVARDELLNLLDRLTSLSETYNVMDASPLQSSFPKFVTRSDVKEAIHVGDIRFTFSNGTVHQQLIPDFLVKTSAMIEQLLEHYRILIYCGQLDLTLPCVPSAEARRKNWHWSGRQDFLKALRLPWSSDSDIAGYVKSGGGLTEVLVRNAGHMVPKDQPARAKQLISHFIQGQDLPLSTNPYKYEFETPPYEEGQTDSQPQTQNNGIIASAVLNVMLIVVIILGIVYWVRWKRRTENYYFNMLDNSSLSDGVLTMN